MIKFKKRSKEFLLRSLCFAVGWVFLTFLTTKFLITLPELLWVVLIPIPACIILMRIGWGVWRTT